MSSFCALTINFHLKYLKENMASLNVKLTEEDIQDVRKAAVKADEVKVGDRVREDPLDLLG